MTDARSPSQRYVQWLPTGIAGLGPLFLALLLVEWTVFNEGPSPNVLSQARVVELLVYGGIAAGLTYGGYRLQRDDLAPERYPRIAGWCFGGLLGFLGLDLLVIAYMPAATPEATVAWVRGTAIFGAGIGLFVGHIEARSFERARATERALARAEYAETRRQWLDYLNSLLRHEVLNKANVIEGNATLARDETADDVVRERLDTVVVQSRHITEVIEDVRALLETHEDPDPDGFDPVNLADVVVDVMTDIRNTYAGVESEMAISGDVFVRADDLLARVLSNLLTNAVEHNDSSTPHVRVSVETEDDTAIVRVADDGPGIPEADRDSLFERDPTTGSSHGLGLYLARTLAERYGGTLELSETGPDGTVFAVRLPRAETPSTDPVADAVGNRPAAGTSADAGEYS